MKAKIYRQLFVCFNSIVELENVLYDLNNHLAISTRRLLH